MDTIIFGNGSVKETDYFVSIPTPQRVFARLSNTNMVEAMQLCVDENAMSMVKYHSYIFINCRLISISSENNVPKVSFSYETVNKEV